MSSIINHSMDRRSFIKLSGAATAAAAFSGRAKVLHALVPKKDMNEGPKVEKLFSV